MAINVQGQTNFRTGTTAVSPQVQLGTGLVAGELYLWHVGSKYAPNLPTLPSGGSEVVTQIAQKTGGAGASGANSGQATTTVGLRIVTSSAESGTLHDVTLASGNSLFAYATRLQKGSGTWDIATSVAAVNTNSTSWVVDGETTFDVAVGDVIFVFATINRTLGALPGGRTISAGAATVGATTLWNFGDSAVGDGLYVLSAHATVTAGSGSITPRFSCSPVSSSGSVVFVRIREATAAAPTVTTQPANATVTEPATATFSPVFANTPTSFLWERSTNAGGSWGAISGATSNNYTTPATSVTGGSANNGDQFRCTATNASGSVTTAAATLTVNAAGDTTPPSDVGGALSESNVTQTGFTITGPAATDNSGVPPTYDYSLDGGTTWLVTNWPAPTYNFSSLTAGTAYPVRRRARDTAGNLSSPLLARTVTTLPAGATITSSPVKDLTRTLHLSSPFEAYISNPTTGALVAKVTGLTSNATTGIVSTGVVSALVASTSYRVVWRRTDTGAEGLETLTAA